MYTHTHTHACTHTCCKQSSTLSAVLPLSPGGADEHVFCCSLGRGKGKGSKEEGRKGGREERGKRGREEGGGEGRKIEGPNIANVFKRTIYQLILKFDIAGRERCAGVVLGLPEAVWNSWGPHFGGLEWADESGEERRNSWIFVLRPNRNPESEHSGMEIYKEIRTEARALVHRAFTIVPERIADKALPGIFESIISRTRRFHENTKLEDD